MQPANGITSCRAGCRAGLLGNPSDGYGGKALAVALSNFEARVTLEAADALVLVSSTSEHQHFPSLSDAAGDHPGDELGEAACDGGVRLLHAAVKQFAKHVPSVLERDAADPSLRFAMRFETTVPRQVGLAGSSAIVIAALRALARWFDVEIAPAVLAELALAAEVAELGIAAGPMDRVIQAYGGLMSMDLKEPRTEASYTRLDIEMLPPMFLAWDPALGRPSGEAHAGLRARWLAGDALVHRAVEQFRDLVDSGVACLASGDHDAFRALMNQNFDLRATIFPVSSRDHRMVEIARAGGGAAKQCGSGGAVIGMAGPGTLLSACAEPYHAAGFAFAEAEFGATR